MMRVWGKRMPWDSGVWMWFEYFHPAWPRFKYIGDVGMSDEGLEMNPAKKHIVVDLGEVCTILS